MGVCSRAAASNPPPPRGNTLLAFHAHHGLQMVALINAQPHSALGEINPARCQPSSRVPARSVRPFYLWRLIGGQKPTAKAQGHGQEWGHSTVIKEALRGSDFCSRTLNHVIHFETFGSGSFWDVEYPFDVGRHINQDWKPPHPFNSVPRTVHGKANNYMYWFRLQCLLKLSSLWPSFSLSNKMSA